MGLARVRRQGATRIAAGENAAGLHDFCNMFDKGSIDIAQPSVTKIGGITEMRKIIAATEAHSIELIPHCAYFGPGNLASIHIVASLATDTLLENIYANLEASPLSTNTLTASQFVSFLCLSLYHHVKTPHTRLAEENNSAG